MHIKCELNTKHIWKLFFSFSSSLLLQCKISQELGTKTYDSERDNFRGKNLIGYKSKNKRNFLN